MSEYTSTTGFCSVPAASLYYECAGDGYPLLLLHAGIADSRMWDDQFATFAQHYRTVRYDLRGYGQTRWEDGSFAAYEDPAALLRMLGIEKAHVIGISYGGKIALDFTLAHPELVASVVLAAPSVGGEEPSAEIRRFAEEEDALFEQGNLSAATELNLRMWVDGPQRTPEQIDPGVRQRVYEMQYHAFELPVPAGADQLELQPEAITRLMEVRVPTLVIVGKLDLPAKLELAQRLAREIAGAQLEIIEGAGHMVSMEKPQEFTQSVLDFLPEL